MRRGQAAAETILECSESSVRTRSGEGTAIGPRCMGPAVGSRENVCEDAAFEVRLADGAFQLADMLTPPSHGEQSTASFFTDKVEEMSRPVHIY